MPAAAVSVAHATVVVNGTSFVSPDGGATSLKEANILAAKAAYKELSAAPDPDPVPAALPPPPPPGEY